MRMSMNYKSLYLHTKGKGYKYIRISKIYALQNIWFYFAMIYTEMISIYMIWVINSDITDIKHSIIIRWTVSRLNGQFIVYPANEAQVSSGSDSFG